MNGEATSLETYYNEEELKGLGLKKLGVNVKISRHAIIYKPEELEVGDNVRIDDFTTISGKVTLGSYIHIAQTCGIYGGDAGIFMDNFTTLSSHSLIYAISNDYSGLSLACPMVPKQCRPADISAPVYMERYALVGCMSVILPGVIIGEGCSVGAMSLCNKNLSPWGVYAGIPATRIKERSKQLLTFAEQYFQEYA